MSKDVNFPKDITFKGFKSNLEKSFGNTLLVKLTDLIFYIKQLHK